MLHIPIDNVKTIICEKFPKIAIEELLDNSVNLRTDNSYSNTYIKPLSQRLLDKIELKEQEPRFPFPEERSIQINAYNAWISNGKKVFLLWQQVLARQLQLSIV